MEEFHPHNDEVGAAALRWDEVGGCGLCPGGARSSLPVSSAPPPPRRGEPAESPAVGGRRCRGRCPCPGWAGSGRWNGVVVEVGCAPAPLRSPSFGQPRGPGDSGRPGPARGGAGSPGAGRELGAALGLPGAAGVTGLLQFWERKAPARGRGSGVGGGLLLPPAVVLSVCGHFS